jgi:hypothetical protein
MTMRLAQLGLAGLLAVALSGCTDKKAEAPKEYAPPPPVGPGGALKGGEAPTAPARPK